MTYDKCESSKILSITGKSDLKKFSTICSVVALRYPLQKEKEFYVSATERNVKIKIHFRYSCKAFELDCVS